MDTVRIQLLFDVEVEIHGQKMTYKDAFYLTQEQYAALTPAALQAMKDERVARWINAIENPPQQSEEQIQAEIDDNQKQIEQLSNPDYVQSQIDILRSRVTRSQIGLSGRRSVK